jgi:hypothetical protein
MSLGNILANHFLHFFSWFRTLLATLALDIGCSLTFTFVVAFCRRDFFFVGGMVQRNLNAILFYAIKAQLTILGLAAFLKKANGL